MISARRIIIGASALLVGASMAAAAGTDERISPWPPLTTDRHAPGNWPVPHLAPAINLDTIPAGLAFNGLGLRDRQRVQASLSQMRLYNGPINGLWTAAVWNGTVLYAERVDILQLLNDPAGSLRVFQHITN